MQVASTPGGRAQIVPARALAPEGDDTARSVAVPLPAGPAAPCSAAMWSMPVRATAAVIRKGRRSPRRTVCHESAMGSAGQCTSGAVYARLGCGDRHVLARQGVRPASLLPHHLRRELL
jgi:hypothetical protein